MTTPLEIVTVLEIVTPLVTLERMKQELRIPLTITDHDSIITDQIESAISWVSEATGIDLLEDSAIIPEALKQAVILLVRDLYTGVRDQKTDSIINAMIDPFIVVT